jgi:hypothetical protein
MRAIRRNENLNLPAWSVQLVSKLAIFTVIAFANQFSFHVAIKRSQNKGAPQAH